MSQRTDQDDWGHWPLAFTDEKLGAVRGALEDTPVILEHRHYRGSRSPDRLVFDQFEALAQYLQGNARPGDSIWFWRYSDLCTGEAALTWGKLPDERGEVPKGGPY